jgi:cytochrome c-type biogenesis protein CcmH
MSPALLVALLFSALTALAALFAVLPVWRAQSLKLTQRLVLLVAFVAVVSTVGAGLYLVLGTPSLAVRTLSSPRDEDVPALIAALAWRAREKPFNSTGWTLLGRGYLSLGDPADAAAAFKRALETAPVQDKASLASAYGEALTTGASGTVTPDAEAAFRSALRSNPSDPAARYYLGLALAQRGDRTAALTIWRGLLSDTPPNAPWRAQLIDHMAAVASQGGGVPDISTMVAGLARRLDANPNDPEGWQRLVRAYAVLGDTRNARTALSRARAVLKADAGALAALDSEARSLKLE